MLLRLDLQSDGSLHFLRVLQERPMYHSTAARVRHVHRAKKYRDRGAELPRLGHPQVHEIPWQTGKCEKSGHSEDLDRGYISWRSPLANALMKASPGDRVELRAPAKTEHLEIIEVEYAPIPMDPFREPLGAQSTPKVERS